MPCKECRAPGASSILCPISEKLPQLHSQAAPPQTSNSLIVIIIINRASSACSIGRHAPVYSAQQFVQIDCLHARFTACNYCGGLEQFTKIQAPAACSQICGQAEQQTRGGFFLLCSTQMRVRLSMRALTLAIMTAVREERQAQLGVSVMLEAPLRAH